MNRPLETTFWMRFTRFVKGVFLYNTIYWKRASDDLDIRHMSREERSSLRPKRNLDIIRPREKPRPTNAEALLPTPLETSEPDHAPVLPPSMNAHDEEGMEVHRRKKRRRSRHSQVLPKHYYESTREPSGKILGWLFKK